MEGRIGRAYANGTEYDLHTHQEAMMKLLKAFHSICEQEGLRYTLYGGSLLGAVRHNGFIPWDDDVDVLMPRKDYEQFLKIAGDLIDSDNMFLQAEFSPHWPMFFSKLRLNDTTYFERFDAKDKEMHQGIYLDIFPCDNASDHPLIRTIQFAASRVVIAKSLYKRGYNTAGWKKQVIMQLCRLLPMRPFLALSKLEDRTKTGHVHAFFGGTRIKSVGRGVYHRSIFNRTIPHRFEDGLFHITTEYHHVLDAMFGDYKVLPPEEERRVTPHAAFVDARTSYKAYIA